jgi:hypothetical protein
MTGMTLQMAADAASYGAAMAMQLSAVGGQEGLDSALLREYLRACADYLGSMLRSDREIPLTVALRGQPPTGHRPHSATESRPPGGLSRWRRWGPGGWLISRM